MGFEMAKQLTSAGKKVEMLAMIDTNIQEASRYYSLQRKIKLKANRQIHKLKFRLRSLVEFPVQNIVYLAGLYKQKAKDLLIKTGLLSRAKVTDLPEYMQVVVDKLSTALDNYDLKPAEVKIDLFKAEERIYYVDDPKYLGWKNLALRGIKTYSIPGDHKDMFMEPGDKFLAQTLQKRLDEIPPKDDEECSAA